MLLTALASNTWWYVGIGIAYVIIIVVLIVVGSILTLAGRIGAQAEAGIDAMDQLRVSTLPVWDVQRTNVLLTAIWKGAASAREALQPTKPEGTR